VQNACGRALLSPEELEAQGQQAPRASGTLESHYAPNAKLRLMDATALQQALDLLGADVDKNAQPGKTIAVYSRVPLKTSARQIELRRMPSDAAVAAHELFSVLREFDALRVKLIWVETPPETAAWDGVRDRLQRAAA
jgi:L-threonylcarbamoyladenylate synthase